MKAFIECRDVFISKEFDQYVAQRARGAYIASVCQPEAAYDLSVAAQAVEPTEKDVSALNKRLQWQIENAARGLRFVQLAKESLQLLVFTDASFANNKDLSSQIGYVLVMADANTDVQIYSIGPQSSAKESPEVCLRLSSTPWLTVLILVLPLRLPSIKL